MPLACLVSLLCACPTARAGSYSGPVYTGGQITLVPAPPPPQPAYSSGQDGYGSGGGTGGSVSCSGPITTRFDWASSGPGDDPPQQVIVRETSTAKYSAVTFGSPSGSCADGLGHEAVPYTPANIPPGASGAAATSSGTRYSVRAGGLSVTLPPCSPTASAGGNAVTNSASVAYSASVTPVTVRITGTRDPDHGDYRALTGQQITAKLQGIGGFTVTHYAWSVSPSTTVFKTYDENAASGQLVPLTGADLAGPTASAVRGAGVPDLPFYDRAQEDLTVSCDVTLTAPDGTSLSVTAKSPTVSVLKPTASWGTASGWVQQRITTYGCYGRAGTAYTDGQSWHDVTVTVPPPFSGGSYCFAQLVTPNKKVYRQVTPGSTASSSYQIPNNGAIGLDNGFPYSAEVSLSNQPAAGTEIAGDSPAINILAAPDAADGGGNNWNQWVYSDSFTTWLMYKPSAGVWVPLQSYAWSWSATVTHGADPMNPAWRLTASNSATAASAPNYTALDTNDPPVWTLKHTNSDTFGPA